MKDKDYGIKTGSWGPYNKEYLGICHIADETKGATFNVEFFPGIYRQKVLSDCNKVDGGVKMWKANADLTFFTYRYELEWKDKVYCDVSYSISDDSKILVDCVFVNNSDFDQSLSLDICLSLHYPMDLFWHDTVGFRKINNYFISNSMKYIDAVDYSKISCTQKIAEDGFYLGEAFIPNATNKGTAISDIFFGKSKTDCLEYSFDKIKTNSIGIRYKTLCDAKIDIIVLNKIYNLNLSKKDDFYYTTLKIDSNDIDNIRILSNGYPITIDCLIVGENVQDAYFEEFNYDVKPIIKRFNDKLEVKFNNIKNVYTVAWDENPTMFRRYNTDDLGSILKRDIHNSLFYEIESGKQVFGIFENIHTGPIAVSAKNKKVLRYYLTSNKNLNKKEFVDKKNSCYSVICNNCGEKYSFSQNMLSYNTLLNVVYPIYNRRRFIIHSTPGRLWNSLYQWDNGFIGLGLATIDFNRAYECLNTYLTPENDIHSPFIFSGTIFPTQIFLYDYLINNFNEKEKLEKLYPLMKSYYKFYSNLKFDSNQMKSGLLKCWHLVYNSGGWDDYPPQKALDNRFHSISNYDNACPENTTPVVTTSVTILIAKILKNIAKLFNKTEDIELYNNDIQFFSNAILNNCYDEKSGYFQYLVHDENGNPKSFLKYDNDNYYNYGFDGIYPYIAQITDCCQSEKIIDNIKNGLMTKYGVSVVDVRAPYFSNNGYWNGNIWFPHQWILWKSLLDHGQCDLASEIAIKALDIWKKEMDESYRSSENFSIETGRGCGYHQFSGLSTPPLLWFKSYFIKNTISTGFFTTITNIKKVPECNSLEFDYSQENKSVVLICLDENKKYSFFVDKKPIDAKKAFGGAYYIELIEEKGFVKIIEG